MNMNLIEKLLKPRHKLEINISAFGVIGFILFTIAFLLVWILNVLYGVPPMLIGIAIYICGGFSGRCVQKQLAKK